MKITIMEKLKKIEITVENEKPEKEKSMKSKAEKKNPKDKRKKCKYCRCVKTLDEERYFEEYNRSILKNFIMGENAKWCLDKLMGGYYGLVHIILMFLFVYCMVFVNNPVYLSCVLVVLSMDALSNVILYDCPLTMLEKKYLGFSSTSTRINYLHKCGFMFTNEKGYDMQLEVLVNAWSMCAMKILFLVGLPHFKEFIKLLIV
jgi:hypothetical protein